MDFHKGKSIVYNLMKFNNPFTETLRASILFLVRRVLFWESSCGRCHHQPQTTVLSNTAIYHWLFDWSVFLPFNKSLSTFYFSWFRAFCARCKSPKHAWRSLLHGEREAHDTREVTCVFRMQFTAGMRELQCVTPSTKELTLKYTGFVECN